ncbi:hypothetical protein [Halobacillus trueperi]|nr:hypothetical protein [Halobacillus trueperi]
MVFIEDGKVLAQQVYVDGEKPYPYGTQVLAFFKNIVKRTGHDLYATGDPLSFPMQSIEELPQDDRTYIGEDLDGKY